MFHKNVVFFFVFFFVVVVVFLSCARKIYVCIFKELFITLFSGTSHRAQILSG